MRTSVEIPCREIVALQHTRASGEEIGLRLFYERAGYCARPVDYDGVLWLRHEWRDSFVAVADIPSSPEGLLL